MAIALAIVHQAPVYWRLLVENAPNVIGFIMPFFIQLITTRLKDDNEKVWASIAMCFFVAALFHWDSLKYGSLDQITQSFGIVFAESHLVFKTFFNTSPFRQKMIDAMGITQAETGDLPTQTKTTSPELG